jgi:hypothetical protein
VSLKHTAEISQLDRSELNIAGLLEFAGAQLICLGPWFLWLLRPKAQGTSAQLTPGYKFAITDERDVFLRDWITSLVVQSLMLIGPHLALLV